MARTVGLMCAALALLFGIVSIASADYQLTYPDGSVALALTPGFAGTHVAAFLDIPGDFDIFTIHATSLNNPLFASLIGPAGIAYFLNFLGTNGFGQLVYDVFVNQGNGFFFVTTVAF